MVNGGKRQGAGRPKGAKDKISRNLKQVVLDTVEKLEKEKKSLHEEATKDPKWFYANFVKPMLPKEVDLNVDGDIIVQIVKYANADNPTAE